MTPVPAGSGSNLIQLVTLLNEITVSVKNAPPNQYKEVHNQRRKLCSLQKERIRRNGVRGEGEIENIFYRIKNTNLEELKAFSDRRSCRGSK
jgi:hypothetical protein